MNKVEKQEVVIKIAGDSGDGIQLLGSQFTSNTSMVGNDLATFPDFPAEIRAPKGTLAGVSGFQIHFGAIEIDTAGDQYDVLVALNAAAYQVNIKDLKQGGILIVDTDGFDAKNLKLAKYGEDNPLDHIPHNVGEYFPVNITQQTLNSLASLDIDMKDKDRCKNMFVLGLLFWIYDRDLQQNVDVLQQKFNAEQSVLEANIMAMKAGYHYGETAEIFNSRYHIQPAKMEAGNYKNIMGNQALTLGLVAAAKKLGKPLFFAGYPITPASEILHSLAKYRDENIKVVQAEDEIAAAAMAIGAVFGGSLGVTCTSGPGMDLKAEAIGLAVSMEIPLVILDIQRGGPSTGMPTKTEQADLLMAMYGRHGECPLPIIAAHSPSDCFNAVIKACEIAFNFNTPVILLSDGYIANSAEPWRVPNNEDIPFNFDENQRAHMGTFERDEHGVRPFIPFGIEGKEYRIGGIEKDYDTGNISYNALNHEKMVMTRAKKVDQVKHHFPDLEIALGDENDEIAIVGWGSTYGAIRSAVKEMRSQNHRVAHVHFELINPFPNNTEELLKKFKKIIVPEMNSGQLVKLIRERYLIDAIPFNKVRGVPFTQKEIVDYTLN